MSQKHSKAGFYSDNLLNCLTTSTRLTLKDGGCIRQETALAPHPPGAEPPGYESHHAIDAMMEE